MTQPTEIQSILAAQRAERASYNAALAPLLNAAREARKAVRRAYNKGDSAGCKAAELALAEARARRDAFYAEHGPKVIGS